MRRVSSVLVALATLALVTGCEKKTKQATPSTASGAAPSAASATPSNVVLFGEVGSLTGAQATFGISTRNGIEMAIAEANKEGGIKGKQIQVKVYDDMSRPEEAANAATRLINEDHVKVLLGEVASTNSLAMAGKANASHVPMISPSSTNPKVTEDKPDVFRVCFIDPFQGFVMAKFAHDNLHLNKVAVLKDQKSDYSIGLSDVFTRKFSELGGQITDTEAYSQGDSDYRAQLTAIKRSNPQAVYVPGYYTDVGLIARQARELGLTVPLLGGDGWESSRLYELGGSAINGSYYSNHYSSEDPSPRVQNFIAHYRERFGEVPDSLAALGYDAAKVAVDAMRRAPDLSGPAVRDAIAQTKDFPGVAGTISLDAQRNAIKPAVVLKVEDGKSHYVTTISP
jgi:branched-chain amino acid transport system substrate-binding protein